MNHKHIKWRTKRPWHAWDQEAKNWLWRSSNSDYISRPYLIVGRPSFIMWREEEEVQENLRKAPLYFQSWKFPKNEDLYCRNRQHHHIPAVERCKIHLKFVQFGHWTILAALKMWLGSWFHCLPEWLRIPLPWIMCPPIPGLLYTSKM